MAIKDGKHVIHAGGIFPNPLLNREGAAAATTTPGTVGYFASGKFTASTKGDDDAVLYVANMDYLRCKNVDEVIPANELVVGIQPLQGMFLNVRAAAGTYTKGMAVTVADGQITPVTSETATPTFGYVEESSITAAAGDLVRIVFK
ncbi:hypothetical protein [Lonsdalea quercina]|uniref:hypothetical protein n=1 Tax=Lonsdalea quercina TaxID=71657 RepID=UPI003975168D